MVKGTIATINSVGAVPGTGTVTSPTVVAVVPSGSAPTLTAALVTATRKLESTVNFNVAGIWSLSWSAVGSLGTFKENSNIPVTYLDILSMVVAETKIAESKIDSNMFNNMLSGMMLYWLSMLEVDIPDYSTASIQDCIIFDTVMSMIMSCYLRPYIGYSAAVRGELQSVGTGPDKIEFHRKYAAIDLSHAEADCLDRAWMMLRAIRSISDRDYENAADQPFFIAAGRRRALRTRLAWNDTENPLYNIRTDEVIDFMFTGGYLNGLVTG